MLTPASEHVEGYDALDMPTAFALAYVRDQQSPSTLPGVSDRPDAEASRRTVIVVDSACDMPQSWLDYHHIVVAPRRIPAASGELTETREPSALTRQLEQLLPIAATTVQSLPSSPVVLRDTIQRHLRRGTTGVIVITASARRSKVYSYAIAAVQSLVLIHTKVRRSLDPSASPLRGWVVDSTNALTGCGVLLAEAVRLRESNAPAATIAQSLNEFRAHVHTLAVPGRFDFIARAARSVEMQPIPLWKQQVAELISLVPMLHMQADQIRVAERVRRGPRGAGAVLGRCLRALESGPLANPLIAVSYAGPLDALEALPQFGELRTQCTRQQVTLSVAPMSMTGALMLGPGALSVSFASRTFRA
jgi:fatty acid-binding protein DegV